MNKETMPRTMNKELSKRISKASVGPAQRFRNLTLFPLLAEDIRKPEYIALFDAIFKECCVTITEVSSGGSVPQLLVTNSSDKLILILDGEELIGAKQNRVANTTILLDAKSKTVIPVSCTEQGRWHSISSEFSHSKTVMSPRVRKRKLMSVSCSLERSTGTCYDSDQAEVWDEIEELHSAAGTHSPTGAMKGAYDSRKEDLQKYVDRFRPSGKQFGMVVFVDGKPAGADMFSTGKALKANFNILTKSYAMDALSSRDPDRQTVPGRDQAEQFLDNLPGLEESEFESVGLGLDCRYDGQEAVGSALMVDDTPVHAAFFTRDGYRDRRNKRRAGEVGQSALGGSSGGEGGSDGESCPFPIDSLEDARSEIEKSGKDVADRDNRLAIEIYRRRLESLRDIIRGEGPGPKGSNENT